MKNNRFVLSSIFELKVQTLELIKHKYNLELNDQVNDSTFGEGLKLEVDFLFLIILHLF